MAEQLSPAKAHAKWLPNKYDTERHMAWQEDN